MKTYLVMLLVLCLLLIACPPPNSQKNGTKKVEGVTVSTKLLSETNVGKAALEVIVTQNGKPLSEAEVTVTGDMTHAGMVPVIAETTEQEAGHYLTKDFEFTMAGDWIITVEVRLPDGQRVNDTLPLSIGRK